ncbi:MAG: hypothetical protein JXA25_10870 [Anaerolineales bacterium]|nr:hypothetical protein [Anaerolineales bacterium]
MDKLKDASGVKTTIVDWWLLFEAGQAEFFQGEPGKPDAYLLPDFSEALIAPVAMLGMCIIHNLRTGEWALAPARQGIDAWEVAAAYMRLGYRPPLFLIHQLTNRPRISIRESHKILDLFRKTIESRHEDMGEMGKILLHIKSNLSGS